MWFILLSTEPGAFRLDERRWEDRKTILITAPKSVPVGAQQIPPTRVNCLAGRIKLSLKRAGIKNSLSRQAQNPAAGCCSPSQRAARTSPLRAAKFP